jgi:hypothetical protein
MIEIAGDFLIPEGENDSGEPGSEDHVERQVQPDPDELPEDPGKAGWHYIDGEWYPPEYFG